MNKPNGYEKAKAFGTTNTPIRLGGHKARIIAVEERKNKNGNDMIVVKFDFHSDDDQPNYFANIKSQDSDKWPNGGTVYINVYGWNDPNETTRQFKGFCTAYEESNNAEIKWGTDFNSFMNGKKIGVVFREEESIWRDEVTTFRKCCWFCDFSKALLQEAPAKKELPEQTKQAASELTVPEFIDMSGVDTSALPF